jgi:hypothetical protein
MKIPTLGDILGPKKFPARVFFYHNMPSNLQRASVPAAADWFREPWHYKQGRPHKTNGDTKSSFEQGLMSLFKSKIHAIMRATLFVAKGFGGLRSWSFLSKILRHIAQCGHFAAPLPLG